MDCRWRTSNTNQRQFNQFLIIVSDLSITADDFSYKLCCGFLENFTAFLQIQTPNVLMRNTFPDSFEAFKNRNFRSTIDASSFSRLSSARSFFLVKSLSSVVMYIFRL